MKVYSTEERDKSKTATEALLEKAKKCLKLAKTSFDQQKQRERDDLEFQVPDLQWDSAARRQRQGDNSSQVPTPARPVLSIDQLTQPRQLIMNQARAAKLGIQIHPVSEDANKEQAEILQGLYRRIERDSNANEGRLWGMGRAVAGGMGAYRVTTAYDEDSDPNGPGAFDQEIRIERILYQDNVYFDPAATKPDFSDGRWAFVLAWMPFDTYKTEFPNSRLAQTDESDSDQWREMMADVPEWVKEEQDERSVCVCEYWYKEIEKEKVSFGGQEREREKVVVKLAKMNGIEILEEPEWMGKWIPIIPVIGVELQPYSSERRWVGMIGPAKDAQRAFNFAASAAVEGVALEPKAPFIGVAGQFEGFEKSWQQANTRNFPFLEYNPVSVEGTPAPPPQRAQVDGSKLNLSMQLMQEATHWLQAATAIYDPSLGRENPRDKSGKAIIALQQQSDAGTSQYLSSLADVSMTYEAKVVLDLIPHVYDRPGRITTILRGDDDEAEHVMLNQPSMPNPQGGPPQAVPEGQQAPPEAKTYDLSKGKYGIAVDIGKSAQTRLQAGNEALSSVISSAPELMTVIGDLFFRFQDFPGASEVADRMKKMIGAQHPELLDQQEGSAEQAQQQLQAAQGQMQQMQQAMQEMQKALETDQVKAQADVEKEKIRAEVEMQKVQIDQKIQEAKNATAIAVAEINARSKGVLSEMEAEHEELATGLEHEHEMEMAQHDTAHDVAMAELNAQASKQAAAEQVALSAEAGEAPEAPESASQEAAE